MKKILKALLGLAVIGAILGFVLSLVTPNLDLSGADISDEDDEF